MTTIEVKLTIDIPVDDNFSLPTMVEESVINVITQYHSLQALKAATEYAKTADSNWNTIMLYHEYWYNIVVKSKKEINIL